MDLEIFEREEIFVSWLGGEWEGCGDFFVERDGVVYVS